MITNLSHRTLCRRARIGRGGFTLVEVSVSLLILGVLLSGLIIAYSRTSDHIAQSAIRGRAMGVAQRKMEYLIASLQEPNVIDMSGQDEDDPQLSWEVELKRVAIDGSAVKPDLSNTVIEIKVTAKYEQEEYDYSSDIDDTIDIGDTTETGGKVELTRYVAGMRPRPGQTIAVPVTTDDADPLWLMALRDKLGREPTPDEVMQYILKASGMPKNVFDNSSNGDDSGNGQTNP